MRVQRYTVALALGTLTKNIPKATARVEMERVILRVRAFMLSSLSM
jgi:hypothetical protein